MKERHRKPKWIIGLGVIVFLFILIIGSHVYQSRIGKQDVPEPENKTEDYTEDKKELEVDTTIEENVETDSSEKKPEKGDTSSSEIPRTSSSGNENKEEAAEDEITCDQVARFSGQYVEDGKDELVEDVAAILVTNHTDQFLDLATLTYDIDGKAATFVVTGLPAGKSAWVMEKSRLVIEGTEKFSYKGMTTSFREDVAAHSNQISITSDGNMLTAKNTTEKTIEGVFVYYKKIHTDGNYFGGITYVVDFGTLEPGKSIENLAGHYEKENTEIVRIGWKKE